MFGIFFGLFQLSSQGIFQGTPIDLAVGKGFGSQGLERSRSLFVKELSGFQVFNRHGGLLRRLANVYKFF